MQRKQTITSLYNTKLETYRSLKKIKRILRISERYNLPSLIGRDLLLCKRVPIYLLICIITTAIITVNVVYRTRLLMNQYTQLITEYYSLDAEWRNLTIKKNDLNDLSRIEKIALEKLQMKHVDRLQENILLQK